MVLSSRTLGLSLVFVCLVALYGCDFRPHKAQKTSKIESNTTTAATATNNNVVSSSAKGSDSNAEPVSGNTLATVGHWSITLDEFNERLSGLKKVMKDFDDKAPGAKQMFLQELIRQQLLVYAAKQEKLDQAKDVKAAVADFENTLVVQEYANRLVKDVTVTQQEAKDYYAANPDEFIMPVEKQLREIVVSSEAEAKDILVKILQNADFAQVAKERSKGKTVSDGGDLGFVLQAPFPQMQKEIEALAKGEVSRVFSGPEGFYIVKIENIRGGDKKSFDDVKEQLAKWLVLKKQQEAVLQKIEEIAKKVNVQVNAGLLKE